MKLSFFIVPATLLLFFISIFTHPIPASAHFFPNVTSIPPSLIPNASIWEDVFGSLIGCRKGVKTLGLAKLKKYFERFGYLNNSYRDFSDDFDDFLESAVKDYQVNFNLNATGELDSATLKHIVLPRCGNPDVVNGTSTMRRAPAPYSANGTFRTVAHYSFFPNRPRWPRGKSRLTYAFAEENELSSAVRGVFARAFERWSEVTSLTFVEGTSVRRADIRIGFFSGDHGDGESFDGELGTLAHAFSPPAGVFHLDGDENWVVDGDFSSAASPLSAVDLESVAVHEIGHLLGLGHSSVEEAIMYPTITSGTRKVELANDDIAGIQELYGSNPNYNGSEPTLTPRRESDSSGAHRVEYSPCRRGGLLAVGLVSLLLLLLF